MKLLNAFFQLPGYFFKHKLYRYVLYSFLISVLLEMGTLVLVYKLVLWVFDWCAAAFSGGNALWINTDQSETGWQTIFQFGVKGVLFLALYFMVRLVNKYILLALLSPVLSAMAERMFEIRLGNPPTSSLQLFWKNVGRSLKLNMRNFLLELFFTLLLWGAGIAASIFLPFIAVIIVLLFSALSFLISAYYYGFGFADFNWEASQVSRKETIQLARQNKMVLILLGAIYQALAALPFVGIPLGSVLCTAIAHLAGAENQ